MFEARRPVAMTIPYFLARSTIRSQARYMTTTPQPLSQSKATVEPPSMATLSFAFGFMAPFSKRLR